MEYIGGKIGCERVSEWDAMCISKVDTMLVNRIHWEKDVGGKDYLFDSLPKYFSYIAQQTSTIICVIPKLVNVLYLKRVRSI